MKLTSQHIEKLYAFTRRHYVEHYDVQTELVDHLANDIEQIWKEKPFYSFDQAKDLSFKKFGVFGFMGIVEEKQKQMGKKYRRIIWNYLKKWFTLPKVILTISFVLIFHFIYQTPTYGKHLFYGIEVLFFLFVIVRATVLIKKQKKRVKETGKNWLLEDIIFRMASSNFMILLCNVFNVFQLAELINDPRFSILLSIFSVLLLLVSYITLELIPKKSEELLHEHYPEYKLV